MLLDADWEWIAKIIKKSYKNKIFWIAKNNYHNVIFDTVIKIPLYISTSSYSKLNHIFLLYFCPILATIYPKDMIKNIKSHAFCHTFAIGALRAINLPYLDILIIFLTWQNRGDFMATFILPYFRSISRAFFIHGLS